MGCSMQLNLLSLSEIRTQSMQILKLVNKQILSVCGAMYTHRPFPVTERTTISRKYAAPVELLHNNHELFPLAHSDSIKCANFSTPHKH